MPTIRDRRRPAVAPTLAFLTGVATGWHSSASAQDGLAIAALFAALVLMMARTRAGGRLLVILLAVSFAVGAWAALDARREAIERAERLFRGVSTPLELHVGGRVVAGPETTFAGERILVVLGWPEPPERPTVDPIVGRLIVRTSPPAPTRLLDSLVPGDEIRVWCRLLRPRKTGNPGATDPVTSLAARGLDALGTVKSARLVERVETAERSARGRIGLIRRMARGRLDVAFAARPEERALAGAMLLGDRAAIDPDTFRRLRAAGLVHLVAISGLHVGLLGCFLVGVLERARIPPVVRAVLVAAFLVGFGQLVGLRPSVLRATLALAMIVMGRSIGRRGDPVNTLALIAVALVACAPARLFDPGFQLTLVATAGILLGGPLHGAETRRSGFVGSGVAVSTSAYLATAPATAWHFGWLAPICLLTNLAALPLCASVLASGYLTIVAGEAPLVGPASTAIARSSTAMLLSLTELAAEVEGGGFAVARPSVATIVSYYGSGLLWLLGRSRLTGRRYRTPALGFSLCVLILHTGPPPSKPPAEIEATVVDVGQGQSVAVRGRSGGTVLVDAAGSSNPRFDPGERIVLPYLLGRSGRRIDTLILSHDHLDHVGGAEALIREVEIGSLCLPPGFHRSLLFRRLSAAARKNGVAVRLCEWGTRFEVGTLRVRIVGPRRGDLSGDANDRSASVLLGNAQHRILVPGDLESEGEAKVTASPLPLRAEALVLSHHGSFSGTSSEFLSRVDPRHSIVSCGWGNRFGHPHPAVCERVRRARSTLWRTDLDGLIRLTGGSEGWEVETTRR